MRRALTDDAEQCRSATGHQRPVRTDFSETPFGAFQLPKEPKSGAFQTIEKLPPYCDPIARLYCSSQNTIIASRVCQVIS